MIEKPNVNALMAGPLGAWLEEHAIVREEAKKTSFNRYFYVLIACVALLPAIWFFIPIPADMKFFVFALAVMGGAFWGYLPSAKAKKEAKTGINSAIAQSLGLTYQHDLDTGEEFEFVTGYEMVPYFNRSAFEDMWSGSISGHQFLLYEAELKHKRGSGKYSSIKTVFQGAIIRIGYGSSFHSTTLLQRSDKHRKFFGGRKDRIKLKGHELALVDMVHPVFEDHFSVWSDDQVEARYLIDPSYVEQLIAVERAFHGNNIRCLFKDSSVIILLEAEDMFESGSMDSRFDRALIQQSIDQFTSLAELAEAFSDRKH